MPKSVAEVIDLETGPATSRDPEKAADALGGIEFTGGAPPDPTRGAGMGDGHEEERGETVVAPKPKRRTKAELEAEVNRLTSEVEKQRAAAVANAPGLIDAMKTPLSLTFRAAGGIMAAWKGDHWRLADQECALLAEAWAPCVGPLLASHPEAVVWAAALGVTYSVVYPRVQTERAIAAKATATAKESTSTGEAVV